MTPATEALIALAPIVIGYSLWFGYALGFSRRVIEDQALTDTWHATRSETEALRVRDELRRRLGGAR